MLHVLNFTNQLPPQGETGLFFLTALVLGALHGLEPGHSKTMMAAFILAVRGTIPQAALLGLSAAFSHSLLVWLIAFGGIYFGQYLDPSKSEPYFQLASSALIAGMAIWLFFRTWNDLRAAHEHTHSVDALHHHHHKEDHSGEDEFQDAHERAHASEMEHRFAGRPVTTTQIVLFGMSGGLVPCPAAITVLLLCLQSRQIFLGVSVVLAFSLGLAVTLVAIGILAAWSVRHVRARFAGLGPSLRKAPYVSSVLLLFLALFTGYQALRSLNLLK